MNLAVFEGALCGNPLRSVVCILLKDARRPMRVSEIVAAIHARGYRIRGRPGKTVADALRCEVGRRRLTKVSRGVYAFNAMPRTTEQSMRGRVAVFERVLTGDKSFDERLDLFIASGRCRDAWMYTDGPLAAD